MSIFSNKKLFIALIFTIIVVSCLLVFSIIVYGNIGRNMLVKKYNMFVKETDKVFQDIKTNESFFNKKMDIKGNIKTKLDLSDSLLNDDYKNIQNAINKSQININTQVDYRNKIIQSIVGLVVENENLAEVELAVDGKASYIKLKDVMDKYYKQELDTDIFNPNGKDYSEVYKDMEVVYNGVKGVIPETITKDDVKTVKEKIEINGKQVSIVKTSLVINDALMNKIGLNILLKIRDDETIFNSYVNLYKIDDANSNKDASQIKEILNDKIENLQDDLKQISEDKLKSDYKSNDVALNIYTKGIFGEIVKIGLSNDEDKYELVINEKSKKEFKADLIFNDKVMYDISVIMTSKDNYEILIKSDDLGEFTVNGKIDDKIIDIQYSLVLKELDNKKVTGKLFMENSNTDEKCIDKLILSIDTGKDLIGSGEISIYFETNYVDTITKSDFSNNFDDIEGMDEDFSTKLFEKVQNISKKLGINLIDDLPITTPNEIVM